MWIAVDLVLLTLAVLRVTRLVTTDDVGKWWLRDPAEDWAVSNGKVIAFDRSDDIVHTGWRGKLVSGLECPFCVGFWIGLVGIVFLEMVGGPGNSPEWWRLLAGVFALNYVVGHVSGRLD